MKPIQVSEEDFLPIASFKARASEVVRSLQLRGRPMIITQNGRPAAVLLSPEEFDRLTCRERFRTAVREGLSDAEAGRVVPDRDLDEAVEREFGKRKRCASFAGPCGPRVTSSNRAIHRPRQPRGSAQMGCDAPQAGARSGSDASRWAPRSRVRSRRCPRGGRSALPHRLSACPRRYRRARRLREPRAKEPDGT